MGRCTKVEHEIRVFEFVKLISSGAVRSDLLQHAAEKWGLKTRQTDYIIAQARQVIVEDINQERQQVTAELLHTMKRVIHGAMKDKQYNNAIGAASLLAKLGRLID